MFQSVRSQTNQSALQEENEILRHRVLEINTELDEVKEAKRGLEIDLNETRALLKQVNEKNRQLSRWFEEDKTLLNFLKDWIAKSEAGTKAESVDDIEESLNQLLRIAANQNAELKRIRVRILRQHQQIEKLVEKTMEGGSRDASARLPARAPQLELTDRVVKFGIPVQCTDDPFAQEKPAPVMIMFTKGNVVDQTDFGGSTNLASDYKVLIDGADTVSRVYHGHDRPKDGLTVADSRTAQQLNQAGYSSRSEQGLRSRGRLTDHGGGKVAASCMIRVHFVALCIG